MCQHFHQIFPVNLQESAGQHANDASFGVDVFHLLNYTPPLPSCRWLNLAGDLEDLEVALTTPERRPKLLKAQWGGRPIGSGHCSALIKVLPGGEDLYTSQVTWSR